MDVEIFGIGCRKCVRLEKLVKEALKELSIDANIDKVEDISEIAERGILSTPALAVDGEVKVSGKVPSKDALKKLFE